MLKKGLPFILMSVIFSISSQNAFADIKTSSLAMEKLMVGSNNLPTQCKQMFSVAHKLVLDAEKQPGTHVQVTKMKNKLSSTKQQIMKMEVKMQEKSCDKGLTALNTLKQKH
ncbi:ABC transporter ATPase [[Haemophilus] ducreyi]|uniref:DUF5339 domain-containing protein n=1 Tax=Haemophilus ducreyi TaxID=730 RepID=UPI0007CDA8B1|nr:DUF5339 domain-containing protein [[Haemophilus] ducreyi]ANF62329.1 ABC transporter ATPase [[Haemophilus] ducreyi]ANF67269.1 ABC transporter ATPase [[Haemophilus] ducreyi]ANF68850.1 ABC transporter ATPase [[Haemophilus] ducreyi]